jgi:hypothetical protein
MFMINCSKEKYLKALAERKPTKAEAELLKEAAREAGFKHLADGRQIAPSVWLTALRADTRGKLALSGLLKCACHCDAAMDQAKTSQFMLLARLQRECPAFFEGMLVPEEVSLAQETSRAQETAAE